MPGQPEPAISTLLLSGPPGVGKTTIIRKISHGLPHLTIRGFLTEEIRHAGRRIGFHLETFGGTKTILAHTELASPHRLGRYGVDLDALERVVESVLQPEKGVDLYLVDEIGKMECMLDRFIAAVNNLLTRPVTLAATIHRSGTGVIGEIKRYPGVEVWEVTRSNRNALVPRAISWIEVHTRKSGF